MPSIKTISISIGSGGAGALLVIALTFVDNDIETFADGDIVQ